MSKKYFLRKSPSELIQEQNRLLETLLAKQDVAVEKKPVVYRDDPTDTSTEVMMPPLSSFDFDFDDEVPYIPTTPTGSANLPTVDTNKVMFDGEGVEKLKKRKAGKIYVDRFYFVN